MHGDHELPHGVVTFLLTDIESSTALWDLDPAAMATALEAHDRLLGEAVARHNGLLVKSQGGGDSTLSVFRRAADAAMAASDARSALADFAATIDTGGPVTIVSREIGGAACTPDADRRGDTWSPNPKGPAPPTGFEPVYPP